MGCKWQLNGAKQNLDTDKYEQMEVSQGAKAVRVCTNRWKKTLMRHCNIVEQENPVCCRCPLQFVYQNNLYPNDKFFVCCWDCLTHTVAVALAKAARTTAKSDNSSLSSVLFHFGPHLFLWWILTVSCARKKDWKNTVCYFLISNTYLIVEGRRQKHNYLHSYQKTWQCPLHCLWQVGSFLESLWV